MKTLKFDTETIRRAAESAGTTPEEYIGKMRSISLGRKVCAHFSRTEGRKSVFICA